LIAVVFVLLLVGIQLLRQMARAEEVAPEKEKGTSTRYLLGPFLSRTEKQPAQPHATPAEDRAESIE
jgi:hypothetical protein